MPLESAEEINVDQLLSEIEKPADERPMSGEATEQPAAQAQEPPAWDPKPWEFDWNGKKVAPESSDKAKIWMSQGYNYSQRMGELNKSHAQKMAEAEQAFKKAQETEQAFTPYKQVDEYAKQNKDWWNYVQNQWQTHQQGQQANPELQQILKPLEEKVGKFEQFINQMQQTQQQEQISKEDQALDQEMESIRKKLPNIDFNATDPATGESLELRILKHAATIGTNSYRVAARDYLHDQLIENAKVSGLEASAKDTQLKAKKGILGTSQAPVKGIQTTSVKGKSYDQLMREGLAELGLAT